MTPFMPWGSPAERKKRRSQGAFCTVCQWPARPFDRSGYFSRIETQGRKQGTLPADFKKFSTKQRDLPKRIPEAVDQSNFQQAADLTHSIKGVAGNIGARQAFEALQLLETALNKNH